MFNNFWFRKEKPFAGFAGFGGGATGLSQAGVTTAVYTEATGGTTNDYTEPGPGKNYRAHIFLASGAFSVTQVGNDDGGGATVEYLVVAGGGGGGGTVAAGGGRGGAGAGGLRTNLTGHPLAGSAFPISTSPGSYTVTVGNGAAATSQAVGNRGGDSAFGPITSTGGGGGSSPSDADGGSGGGAQSSGAPNVGAGNTPDRKSVV